MSPLPNPVRTPAPGELAHFGAGPLREIVTSPANRYASNVKGRPPPSGDVASLSAHFAAEVEAVIREQMEEHLRAALAQVSPRASGPAPATVLPRGKFRVPTTKASNERERTSAAASQNVRTTALVLLVILARLDMTRCLAACSAWSTSASTTSPQRESGLHRLNHALRRSRCNLSARPPHRSARQGVVPCSWCRCPPVSRRIFPRGNGRRARGGHRAPDRARTPHRDRPVAIAPSGA